MVQKRETKAINKLCVREILSLSFVCGAYFFEFRGRNLVCFGIAYNFDWGRHWQIRAGSREGTHAHCVFHACPHPVVLIPPNITDTVPINNNVMMGTEKTTAGTENSPYLTCGKLVLALGMGTE